MSTVTIYADTTDAYLRSSDTTYSSARAGTGSSLTVTNNTNGYCGQTVVSGTYIVFEYFVSFNTSSVGGWVTSATLAAYVNVDDTGDSDFTVNARANDWGPAVATDDWITGASLSGNALRATFDTTGLTTGAYQTFTSDSSFASNTASPVRLVLASSAQEANTTPTVDNKGYINFLAADNSGTTYDPKLTIVAIDKSIQPIRVSAAVTRAGAY